MAHKEGVIYCRISAADVRRARAETRGQDQAEFEKALAEKVTMHLAECREYAHDEGIVIAQEFVDNNRSASRFSTKSLPERDSMLLWLRQRPGRRFVVLSTEVERLYRQSGEAAQFCEMARRTPLIVMSTDGETWDLTTANGEANFMGAVAKAQRESGKISERRRRRERKRAQDGGYWGTDPFGYHKVYEADLGGGRYYTGRLEIDPREAAAIREAARHLIAGGRLRRVVLDWNAAGITTRTGKPWTVPLLRGMLLNPRLNGKRVHRPGDNWGRAPRTADGAVSDGLWDAILDDGTFAALQVVLTDPSRRTYDGNNARKYLLVGLAYCGRCGARMKTQKGRLMTDGTVARRYVCPDRALGGNLCTGRSVPAVDEHVTQVVFNWLLPDGPYAQYVAGLDAMRADAEQIAAIEQEDQVLRLRKRAISTAIASGAMDLEVGADAAEQINTRLYELQRARAALQLAEAPETHRPPTTEEWASWDATARHEFLSQFADKVVIYPGVRGQRYFDPEMVDVIPSRWADHIERSTLAVVGTAPVRRLGRSKEAVTTYLERHPWSTAKQVAAALEMNWSHAYNVLNALEDEGLIARQRPGRGRGGGKVSMKFALASAAQANAS
jgi:DNA invertase Pin-like site-specific DNA recombinase